MSCISIEYAMGDDTCLPNTVSRHRERLARIRQKRVVVLMDMHIRKRPEPN
jgi:hypothetical protein